MTPILFMIRVEQDADGEWVASWEPLKARAPTFGDALIGLARQMAETLPEPSSTPVPEVGLPRD